jgi:hypothetical protein
MKTGRLLKFQRPAGEVQAYLYREGGLVKASIYAPTAEGQPVHSVSGASEAAVEGEVRAWVDAHFPKAP